MTVGDLLGPRDQTLFEPVPGSTRGKVRCRVCGAKGYPDGPWQDTHLLGHTTCICGRWLPVRRNLTRRVHQGCPQA